MIKEIKVKIDEKKLSTGFVNDYKYIEPLIGYFSVSEKRWPELIEYAINGWGMKVEVGGAIYYEEMDEEDYAELKTPKGYVFCYFMDAEANYPKPFIIELILEYSEAKVRLHTDYKQEVVEKYKWNFEDHENWLLKMEEAIVKLKKHIADNKEKWEAELKENK